jgi:hypothetical protein
MASEKKKRKVDKRLHWGRGGRFLKAKGKGIKRLDFFTSSQRRINNDLRKEICAEPFQLGDLLMKR